MSEITNILESAMMVAFGIAWPANILNSIKVKSSRDRSPYFLFIVFSGYIFGIAAKLLSPNGLNYVILFYLINLLMVSFDIFLYFHYRKLDRRKN
ncbi:MAG: hypothetical protein LBT62_07515 [Deltaproteobacteria bacterium]|jgi:hypothetical protein|nr:hypothetical protein [Deltaproteobacteria bacterium]